MEYIFIYLFTHNYDITQMLCQDSLLVEMFVVVTASDRKKCITHRIDG